MPKCWPFGYEQACQLLPLLMSEQDLLGKYLQRSSQLPGISCFVPQLLVASQRKQREERKSGEKSEFPSKESKYYS